MDLSDAPAGDGRKEALKRSAAWLSRSMTICFGAIAIGQIAFILFIALYYYPPTLSGNFAAWNNKPIITGHVAGDTMGNLAFAFHVLGAALMTGSGLLQPVATVRRRWPTLHRWNGRLFVLMAGLMALNGLVLVWVRGSWTSFAGGFGVSLNAAAILLCAYLAVRFARTRDFASHRRWALRLFVTASGVWFTRVFYMAWAIPTGGAGIKGDLTGPFDMVVPYASFLIPLAVLEIYFRAERSRSVMARGCATGLLALSALVVLGGSAGAWMAMWSPYV